MRDEQRIEPTKERVAKGDLRMIYDPDGRQVRTQVLPKTIIGWLVEREIIDPYYESVASHFSDWHDAFKHPTDYKTSSLYRELGHEGDGNTASRFVWVCAKLGTHTAQFLLDAIEPGWDVCPAVNANDYLWALKKLDKAMAEAAKEV